MYIIVYILLVRCEGFGMAFYIIVFSFDYFKGKYFGNEFNLEKNREEIQLENNNDKLSSFL